MKSKQPSRLLIVILMLSTLFAGVQFIPQAVEAQTITSQCTQAASSTPISCSLTTINGGDTLLVVIEYIGGPGCPVITITGDSATYTQGVSGTTCIHSATFGTDIQNQVFYAVNAASGSTVSIQMAASISPAYMSLEAYAISGLGASGQPTISSTDSTTNTCSGCSSFADAVTSFTQKSGGVTVVSSSFESGSGGVMSQTTPTSFTQYPATCNKSGNAYLLCSDYWLNPSGATTASLTDSSTLSGTIWANEVAFSIGPGNANVVTVIGPCNFFQLQCWWYPLLFMSAYSGILLLVSQWLLVSPRGKAHIFLSAVTFGSLLAVILGIMNIVFPLLMLILNTLIVLRIGRG